MNTLTIILLIIAGIIIVLLALAFLNAFRLKGKDYEGKPFDSDELADSDKYANHLSQMIQVETVSVRGSDDKTKIYEFHRTLEKLYPNIHSKLEKTDIA